MRILLIILLSMCFISCEPTSKADYMKEFESFIDNLESQKENPKDIDWEATEKQYQLYADTYYKKFKEELKLGDEINIASLKVRYHLVKNSGDIDNTFDTLSKSAAEIKDKIQFYLDNNLEDDLNRLKETATKLGDSISSKVQEIIEEIEAQK